MQSVDSAEHAQIVAFLTSTTYLFCCRFVDISIDVRVECIKRAKEFLQHHPDLAADLAGKLCLVNESLNQT